MPFASKSVENLTWTLACLLLLKLVWNICKIIRQCSIYLTCELLACKLSTSALVAALAGETTFVIPQVQQGDRFVNWFINHFVTVSCEIWKFFTNSEQQIKLITASRTYRNPYGIILYNGQISQGTVRGMVHIWLLSKQTIFIAGKPEYKYTW